MVYFSNEQGIGLSSYRREANGQLKVEQDISILPPGMSKIGLSASDLLITPDGNFSTPVYADTVRILVASPVIGFWKTAKPSFLGSPKPTKSPGD